MAFARHYRITALGYLGSSVTERFSYGLNFIVDEPGLPWGSLDFSLDNASLADIADDVAAFHGRADSRIHSKAVLDTVKIAEIREDGKYNSDPLIFPRVQAGTAAAGVGFQYLLPQSALVASLNTDRRGPTGKGRFYIPMPVVSADDANGFRISVAEAEAVRGSVAQLLNNINDNPGLDVVSPRVVVASTKGYNTPVTSIRIGRIVDTMQSRRRQLGEAYTADLPLG